MIHVSYFALAEGPGVAREKKIRKKSTKKFSPIGPAVWPAIDNINIRMSCFIIFI